LNRKNSSISLENNFFVLNLTEGSYDWGIVCNDTQNRIDAVNYSFTVDTTSPNVSVTEPAGTKSSLTVSASFVVSDNFNVNYCYYNVSDVNDDILISNREIANCSSNSSLSFTLGGDQSNANFNLWANDSSGNVNFSSIIFSVDTSSSPPGPGPSGGGGGGGGGGSFTSEEEESESIPRLTFLRLGEILMKEGTKENINLEIVNNGNVFANNCKLIFSGPAGGWLNNNQNEGLSPGEKIAYDVEITAPQSIDPGEYKTSISVECDEGSQISNARITIYRNAFEAEILNYERDGNDLKVSYSIKESFGNLN